MNEKILIFDTTLRDGTQRQGLSLSVIDKLRITELLDAFGVSYIEGGWPGSNPKDAAYFQEARKLKLKNAKITAFGSTCRVGAKANEDPNLKALVEARVSTVALVGKSWDLHVREVLRTTPEENLRIIGDSISFLKGLGIEVIYDAEHFFDGFKANEEFALKTLSAAAEAGADWLTLCDTNGGTLPDEIFAIVSAVKARFLTPIGIHTHNDSELAVANSLQAVRAGARQVQGTINGYGERCGNANLISVIPNLQLKYGYDVVSDLAGLTKLSRTISEIVNFTPDHYAPFVGKFAFAHKGGIHAAAVERIASSYEHLEPSIVGNSRKIVISELSGRGNIRLVAESAGIDASGQEERILNDIKKLEEQGYQFENADGSVELILRRNQLGGVAPFSVAEMSVESQNLSGRVPRAQAVVKIAVNGEEFHTVADADGPVRALDIALRKALLPSYPELAELHLEDYKVRILDPETTTDATVRVFIEAASATQRWVTVGCSRNIIEASFIALADSFELFIRRTRECSNSDKLAGNS